MNRDTRIYGIVILLALITFILFLWFKPGWGQDTLRITGGYVGLNYSEEKVLLKNIKKDSLKIIFDKKDSTKIIQWKVIWEDSSHKIIIIDPAKCSFHSFWYPMCTSPWSKLIVDGKPHKPIIHLRHEIKVIRKSKDESNAR